MSAKQNNLLCQIKNVLEAQPGGDCDDPIHVISCEPPADMIDVDTELVCNSDTGVYDTYVTTTTNGVTADPVVTPTTISCADPDTPPDVEQVRVCDDVTGTYHIVTTAFDTDGTPTELSNVDTGQTCGQTINHTTVRECRNGTIHVVTRAVDETNTITEIEAIDTGETCDEPSTTADVEFVCNADTGVYDLATTPIVDGVAGETVYTPTELSCAPGEPPLDVELIDRCIDGTIHQLSVAFDAEGIETVFTDVDTGQDCYQGQPDCVKWSANFVQIDNTGTSFTESHEITLTNSDGTTTVLNIAAQAGWSQQITEWASQLDAAYGGTFDPRCTFLPNGCGGLLPPPADSPPQKGIYARYVQGVFCPTDKIVPIAAEVTDSSNPARIGRKLVLHVVEGPEYRGQVCRTCADGAGELQFEDGTPVPEADLPVCFFSCAESIPVPPTAACEFDAFESGCDNVGEPGDNTNWVTVTRILSICEGVTTVDYYVADPDDPTALIDHILIGDYVDCDTGEPIPESEPVEDCGCLYDLVVPIECGDAAGTCQNCTYTTANYDPDQGSQWDAIAVTNGVAVVTAGPNGTGSWSEQMAGTNPQCSGDLWLARMGAYDGPPGAGTLLAEGYVLGSSGNVNGSSYTLGAPTLGVCASEALQAALISGGFTPAEAASLTANGYATVDVFNAAGATHINGVFDAGAPTPFGLCITQDETGCTDTDESNLALPVTDKCLEAKLDTLIETQTATNDLLAQLVECLCGPCDDEDLGEPLGDQVTCATEKMGADFVSNATGEGTHTAGSMFTGTGPLAAWVGTFTVTDSAGTTHVFNDGDTVTGMATGATTGVTFTGQIEFVKDGETFRCPVTDKPISANFTVL